MAKHAYAWSGRVPGTGVYCCVLCGDIIPTVMLGTGDHALTNDCPRSLTKENTMRLIPETKYKPPGPDPLRVRLVEHTSGGVTMQVLVEDKWLPLCTLGTDGTLGLWDVKNDRLASAGFDMGGRTVGLGGFGSFISVHIQ